MAQKPESKLQRKIRERLEEQFGGRWTKLHGGPFQEAGLLDIMGCLYGFHIEIEVKTDVDTRGLSDLQQERIDTIRANGGCAFVTASPGAACRKVRKWLIRKLQNVRQAINTYELQHGPITENSTLWLPAKDRPRSAEAGRVRTMDGTGDWKNPRLTKNRRRPLEKEFGAPGSHRRALERHR